MPVAISCTRATAPRAVLRTLQCRRSMSTETTAVTPSAPPATPVRTKGVFPTHHRTLGEKMHRVVYPQYYEKDAPVKATRTREPRKQQKPISVKWEKAMTESNVNQGLSKRYGVPIYTPSTTNIKKTCPHPLAAVTTSQTSLLDPTGARTRLFAKENPERACVGDILLVRQRTGDPFAGVCINIRRRGADTAILLRGQLTRVGVEMWYKVYSPLVEGIEIVQRAAKRARRARLTYMRTPKHDRGNVENVVRLYMRQKMALGMGGKKEGGSGGMKMAGGKKKGKGKKR